MLPINGGSPGMIDRFVREAEETINKLGARRESLIADLEGVEEQIAEARGVLQFLRKQGKGVKPVKLPVPEPVPEPTEGKGSPVSREDYLEAIKMQEGGEFEARDIAELAGSTLNGARNMLSRLVDDKVIRVTRKSEHSSRGRTPTFYRELRPPV